MRKSVVVIYGSDSSEWEVSVRSGEFTASQLDGAKYDVYEMFKTTTDAWEIGEKIWKNGKNVLHDINISLENKDILDKLRSASKVDIKSSDIYIPAIPELRYV